MHFNRLRDMDIAGKTVLLRADLNVPKHNNIVTDTTRIDRLKPTIEYLHKHQAKVLILSHYGRPEGEQNPEMSMAFLAPLLEQQWGIPVQFSPQCIGDVAKDIANAAKPGDVVLLENLRFHNEEKANDLQFAQTLADLGDLFVNDAFSASHRAHASTVGITQFLPCAAGLLMEEELTALTRALEKPEKPLLAVTGGSKISTKLGVLEHLIEKVDYLVLGGGMANTFLYAKGISMGRSLCEKDMQETAQAIMAKAEKIGCEIILPKDVVVVTELKQGAEYSVVGVDDIPDDHMAIDIGEQSVAYIANKIKQSRTVVWNGPLGVFEIKPFDNGTNQVAKVVAAQTIAGDCVSIAGGGDTVSALENADCADHFSYISTAGGAFLEWLEGKQLPGVAPLLK